ncbi:hypothetical protein [Flectobacillus major]|jgi:chromosome segregation ATPase|uniref:hypothetical protein n=1 Tax=Flectobacillus major TaxID=103 RepID=UPI0005C4F9D7|nr:hypothetical protein [Flectobacillus major]
MYKKIQYWILPLLAGNLLYSCISTKKYDSLVSSKNRLSSRFEQAQDEIHTLRERSILLSDKLDIQSQNFVKVNQQINQLKKSFAQDSLKVAAYKNDVLEKEKELAACRKGSVDITNHYEGKLKLSENTIKTLGRKVRFERRLRIETVNNLIHIYEAKLNSLKNTSKVNNENLK